MNTLEGMVSLMEGEAGGTYLPDFTLVCRYGKVCNLLILAIL